MKRSGRIFVSKLEDAPTEEHYAIFEFTSHISPGYDAGDPDYSSPHVEYVAYLDRAEWEAEITRLKLEKYTHKIFMAARVIPAKVKTNFVIEVSP